MGPRLTDWHRRQAAALSRVFPLEPTTPIRARGDSLVAGNDEPTKLTRYSRLVPRAVLPSLTDSPKQAFLGGWWAGIAVGLVNGIAIGVVLIKAVH